MRMRGGFGALAVLGALAISATGCANAGPDADPEAGAPTRSDVVTIPGPDTGSDAGDGVSSSGSCAAVVEFEGRRYFLSSREVDADAVTAIGAGSLPPCADTPNSRPSSTGAPHVSSDAESAVSWPVGAVDGFDPDGMLAVRKSGSGVWELAVVAGHEVPANVPAPGH